MVVLNQCIKRIHEQKLGWGKWIPADPPNPVVIYDCTWLNSLHNLSLLINIDQSNLGTMFCEAVGQGFLYKDYEQWIIQTAEQSKLQFTQNYRYMYIRFKCRFKHYLKIHKVFGAYTWVQIVNQHCEGVCRTSAALPPYTFKTLL